jgi:hypothetical protein
MKRFALLAGAALGLAACAGEPEAPFTVSDVAVEADLSAVGSRTALTYWSGLSEDLESAIAGQYAGRIDPDGYDILVDIDELSLATAFAPSATGETARLSGRVELIGEAGTLAQAYDVTASATDVAEFLPAGSDIVSIPPTSSEYYAAVVQAFARGVKLTLDNAEM